MAEILSFIGELLFSERTVFCVFFAFVFHRLYIFYGQYILRRRPVDMQDVASRLGFEFKGNDVDFIYGLNPYKQYQPSRKLSYHLYHHFLAKRSRRIAHNLMQGTMEGIEVFVFDDSYITAQIGEHIPGESPDETYTKNLSTTQTLVLFYVPALSLPKFELMPHKADDLLFNLSSYKDRAQRFHDAWMLLVDQGFTELEEFELDDHPEFSANYALRAPDEAAVEGLFSAELIGLLAKTRGTVLMGSDSWLIVGRDELVTPPRLKSFLDDAYNLCQVVISSQRGAAPPSVASEDDTAAPVLLTSADA